MAGPKPQTSNRKRAAPDTDVPHYKKSKTSSTETKPWEKPKQTEGGATAAFKSSLVSEEVSFPRGGGSSLTPLEYKEITGEARKQADADAATEAASSSKKIRDPKKRKDREIKAAKAAKAAAPKQDGDFFRVEHLNYKKLSVGTPLLGRVHSIHPLHLVLSLPNQIFAHVPITHISRQLTERLQASADSASDSDEEDDEDNDDVPSLDELFKVGQYVRGRVSMVYGMGTSSPEGLEGWKPKDQIERDCRRVEVSLVPEVVNNGVAIGDLEPGFCLTAAVKSVEDHGYLLDLGLTIEGFLPFKDAKEFTPNSVSKDGQHLEVGHLINCTVTSVAENKRTCTFTLSPIKQSQSTLTNLTSITSLLPGALCSAIITAVIPDSGLNLKLLGFFSGSVDTYHLPANIDLAKEAEGALKVGKKIKVRVLYESMNVGDGESEKRFGCSLKEHILEFNEQEGKDCVVGEILEEVEVKRVEGEWGLVVENQEGRRGFAHIAQVSDEHIPHLSSTAGPFALGTTHRARVIGHSSLDNLLQLSLKSSVLNQNFLRVEDVTIGQFMKGTVKRLTEKGLFLDVGGNVDGVVWPTQYADIRLKNPERRFKVGSSVKCRVLNTEVEKNRVVLTMKKALLESELPIVTSFDDARPHMITDGTVTKILEKGLLVDLYGTIRAYVPVAEASESFVTRLDESFFVGKPVKVKLTWVDRENLKITASIKKAVVGTDENTSSADAAPKKERVPKEIVSVASFEKDTKVEGTLIAIHSQHLLLTLEPSKAQALLSQANAARNMKITVEELKKTIKVGDNFDGLIVISKDEAKGLVFVAHGLSQAEKDEKARAKAERKLKPKKITLGSFKEGDEVEAIVKKVENYGIFLRIEDSSVSGLCHKSEISDDPSAKYETVSKAFREGDKVKALVLSVDIKAKKIAFSLKASHFSGDLEMANGEDDDEEDDDDEEEEDDDEEDGEQEDAQAEDKDEEEADELDEEYESDDEVVTFPVDEDVKKTTKKAVKSAPSSGALNLSGGFNWNADDSDNEGGSDSDSDDEDVAPVASTSQIVAPKKKKVIQEDLTGDLHTKTPESTADFERLLIGAPNSSFLWIQYMSFQLSMSEVQKAREIAQRALKAIGFREEEEKLNVWIALLNLENSYGTEEEVEACFKKAIQFNEPETVHLRMAGIFEQSEKFEKAEEIFKRAIKKFSQSPPIWTAFAEYYMNRGDAEAARELLPRAMKSLPKLDHVGIITKFAQLEYRVGDAERGKTIFEGVIDSYPKRLDLWNVYIDLEAKAGDIHSVRSLFDRLLARKLTQKKAKSVFKKWMEIERRLAVPGDESGTEMVKTRAIAFVQKLAGVSSESAQDGGDMEMDDE
ncbi:rRNA processing protein Rrp5 [Phaffia rhodozyma]|uniref:rRNA processing protein Rrp5 n=1 Tax=Phaffia rhodozyma TaxID=264483 RepID=A0A0F7SEG1_PHARH|nr:rRNA processing protein Rrp5 [Phaffia rhodozyma]